MGEDWPPNVVVSSDGGSPLTIGTASRRRWRSVQWTSPQKAAVESELNEMREQMKSEIMDGEKNGSMNEWHRSIESSNKEDLWIERPSLR